MHFLFSLLRIKGLYVFRALLAHPQEEPHKRHLVLLACSAVLLSIPKEAFADSFQKLYERCQPCVVKDDDYFEGQ
jgi:hypothetical protein